MRLAHLADIHLGFRQYGRSTATGQNQREADVADAFRRAIDGVIAARPDCVVLAGDIFHAPRPTNWAILTAFAQLQRLRQALPAARVVLIAGDHDTPRTADSGLILDLFRAAGADVAILQPERWRFGSCTLTAVPKASAHQIPPPDPEAGLNVLVIHGEVAGFGNPGRAPGQIDPAALGDWDYVALGHYHCRSQVAPNAWYAGSLEYVSTDPWSESTRAPKGWLLVDLPGGAPAPQLTAPRRFLDLAPLDAVGLAAPELDAQLAARLGAAELEGACVRLVVTNLSRDLRRAIDYAALRAFKARAFHLQLELRSDRTGPTAERRGRTFEKLDTIVARFLEERQLPPGMAREDFVREGLDYLQSVTPEQP